jgi:TPR repeat protein
MLWDRILKLCIIILKIDQEQLIISVVFSIIFTIFSLFLQALMFFIQVSTDCFEYMSFGSCPITAQITFEKSTGFMGASQAAAVSSLVGSSSASKIGGSTDTRLQQAFLLSPSPSFTLEPVDVESSPGLTGFRGRCLILYDKPDGSRFVVQDGLSRPSADILSRLSCCTHPHLLRFTELQLPGLSDFLVEELLQPNGTLSTAFSAVSSGRLCKFFFRRWILDQLLGVGFGLLYLHSQHLFHGSLNPSRLRLGGDDILRLDLTSSLYFNGDRFFESKSSLAGYFPPEFVSGCDINCWSDVYSFGILLYESFTGSSIVSDDFSVSAFHHDLKSRKQPKLPDFICSSVGELIFRCLSYDCHCRPSMESVLDELLKMGPDPFTPSYYPIEALEKSWSLALGLEKTSMEAKRSEHDAFQSGIVGRLWCLADCGDAAAQNRMGFLLRRGLGCSQDAALSAFYYGMSSDQGNAIGQVNFGLCLRNGEGVDQDLVLASRYFKMSADQGYSGGMLEYGACLEQGKGVERDLVSAARYYKMSADTNDSTGMYLYGLCLMTGQGVYTDLALGAYYFDLSASAGNPAGMFYLAQSLAIGRGVERNQVLAADFSRRSAKLGYFSGMVEYGRCLEEGHGVERDMGSAVKYYKTAADHGNSEGMWRYGACVILLWKDFATAARYYKMSADLGSSEGMFCYGLCLEFGRGVATDLHSAALCYKMSGDLGNPIAMCNYGVLLKHGRGVEKDLFFAAHYFEQSANLGHSPGMYWYGLCLETGEGVEQDFNKAARYYKMSADLRDSNGLYKYGTCLANGQGVDKDLRSAARYYKMSADLGNASGMNDYGTCLESGRGVESDLTKAVRYYKMSADEGDSIGQVSYGFCLEKGHGVAKDLVSAARYYKRSADQGNPSGLAMYSFCLSNGHGVERDLISAARYGRIANDMIPWDSWFRSFSSNLQSGSSIFVSTTRPLERDRVWIGRLVRIAADLGNSSAMDSYGFFLTHGLGVEVDLPLAAHYYKMSADAGNASGMLQYGVCLYRGWGIRLDLVSAAEYYKQASDQGNCDAMRLYGVCLEFGFGVDKDLVSAAQYYKMAGESGQVTGLYEYGRCLVEGKGVEKDADLATRYFRQSADSGDPVCMWRCATRFQKGEGIAKDEEAACHYFELLESNTNTMRLLHLASILRFGREAEINLGEALRWYRRCADLGDIKALEYLGLCYEKGIGVIQDLREAGRFYERVSEMGSRVGRLSLGLFYWRGLGGFRGDRWEAVRQWRLAGLEVPDSVVACQSSVSCDPFSPRESRFFGSNREGDETRTSPRLENCSTFDQRTDGDGMCSRQESRSSDESMAMAIPERILQDELSEATPNRLIPEFDRFESETLGIGATQVPAAENLDGVLPLTTCESFILWNTDYIRSIESVVVRDKVSVREFLGAAPPASEIARLTGEGIRREGSRCLGGVLERDQGNVLYAEIINCDTIESVHRVCAEFYTRDTFLYRRVNEFLRSSGTSDADTGRNLGLYMGVLRECFCVSSLWNPVPWGNPPLVYRGASFEVDIVIDYARRPEEIIRWQGFTSTSGSVDVALGFPGNVLFEISLTHAVASLAGISAFQHEQEFVISPYQWFALNGVRWDCRCQRWIFSVREQNDLPDVASWFRRPATS